MNGKIVHDCFLCEFFVKRENKDMCREGCRDGLGEVELGADEIALLTCNAYRYVGPLFDRKKNDFFVIKE